MVRRDTCERLLSALLQVNVNVPDVLPFVLLVQFCELAVSRDIVSLAPWCRAGVWGGVLGCVRVWLTASRRFSVQSSSRPAHRQLT